MHYPYMGIIQDRAPEALYAHNAKNEARCKLRRLRQTGGILDYVKEFTTLMLKIESLPDKDALFYFKEELKDWARVKLDRRNVQTLDDAIAVAKALVNYLAQKGKKSGPNKSRRDRSR